MHQTGFSGRSDTAFSPFAANSFGHFGSNRPDDDVPLSAAPSGRHYIKRDTFSYNRRGGGRQLSNYVDIEAKNPFAFRNFGSEGLNSNDR